MKILSLVQRMVAVSLLTVLAACSGLVEGDNRHLQPLSSSTTAALRAMGSSPGEAMLIRIFKESSELEVWKRTSSGKFRLFKTYEICTWSGALGPKIREGDRQAPEGFYTITPGLMNPRSNYYLSFNLGYPNKFDRSYGRTGAHLMVHGDCSSAGCYAMTDEQIAEIYALARETFEGGNSSFQVQAYPFRMTSENMARHYANENIAFWQNLKVGYDHFEATQLPPRYDVCGRNYVFNASSQSGSPLDARAACPQLSKDAEIEALVAVRQSEHAARFAALVAEAQEREANAQQRAVEAEQARVAAAERKEAIDNAVSNMGGAVSTFFGNLFGGGQQEAPQSQPVQQSSGVIPPTPAAPVR